MNRQRRAKWMKVGSMAIFGTIGAFVCHIPLPSGEIALWRAVLATVLIGGAVGHNPISIIIPCHRVIGTDGSLTGYAGGLHLKRHLLTHEGIDITHM